jgi:predicted GNAT family N-acyltransferase
MSDETKAQELISIFVCEKDADIENFLKIRAIQFEKLGKSRTFFIYDEDQDEFQILAYFTLAIQVLKISGNMLSGRKAKLLDGFSSKIKGLKITEFPSILIGQLGKNEMYTGAVSGSEVLEYCLATILEGQVRLGGRIIMLECKDEPYLINLYEKFGFNVLEREYEEGELLQMIKILEKDEIIEPKEEI